MRKIYNAGDMVKLGSQMIRAKQSEVLRNLKGYTVYNPMEDKSINDKTNQTVESNNGLAERIYDRDMAAIRKSDIVIFDIDNDSIGTVTELGAVAEFKWFREHLERIAKSDNVKQELDKFLKEYPRKTVYCHNTDIRNTNLEEKGFRRSYSINQFLYGACLYATGGKDIGVFDDVVKELKK